MDRDEERDEELAFRATAVAELHAFYSPYFIWRSIWEEVVPREKLDPSLTWDRKPAESDVYEDRFGITTGRYGLIRLLGLWYICGEMYQGYYPPMSLILNMIAHRVGADRPQRGSRERDKDRTYRDEVGDTARTTARDAIAPIVPKPDDPGRGFGWFRTRTYREVTGRPSDHGSKTYVACSEDFVLENVFAIVNTAFTVARIVQSDEWVARHRESAFRSYANEGKSHAGNEGTGKEVFESLNRPEGESFAMDLTRLIRRELRANGFDDGGSGGIHIGRLRGEDEPKVNFFDYEAVEKHSSADDLMIPEPLIGPNFERARKLHRERLRRRSE